MQFVDKEKIEADISARSYKKLMEKIRGYNKKELLHILDHYLVHVIDDTHVDELLSILNDREDHGGITAKISQNRQDFYESEIPVSHQPKEATVETDIVFTLPEELVVDSFEDEERQEFLNPSKFRRKGPQVDAEISDETLDQNKDRLELLFDRTFFESYLSPRFRSLFAETLIDYAQDSQIPVQPFWVEFAERNEVA